MQGVTFVQQRCVEVEFEGYPLEIASAVGDVEIEECEIVKLGLDGAAFVIESIDAQAC